MIPQTVIKPFGVLGFPKPVVNPCAEVVEDFQIVEVHVIPVLRSGDRVILHFDNNPEENGIYEVTSNHS